MQQASNLPEVTVSEKGVVIPVETLRASGIQPGDRVTFARTTRGSLLVLPAARRANGLSLRAVVGIAPRPAGMERADDAAFLRAIRSGDDVPQGLKIVR